MKLTCADLTLDCSRQDKAALSYVPDNEEAILKKARAWLAGERVNDTEDRAAMHMALRGDARGRIPDLYTQPVIAELARLKTLVQSCNAEHVLHIGIGGSDLGPKLVVEALQGEGTARLRKVDFLASLTPEAMQRALSALNPLKSIVILTSKSYSTDEIQYILQKLLEEYKWPKHRILVVTARPDRAHEAGFDADQIVSFWEWVGGRYSLWSGVGLVIALTYGWPVFEKLLAGAGAVDTLLYDDLENSGAYALAKLWRAQRIMNRRAALAFLPYHSDLGLLSAWAQQLVMESNGKPSAEASAPIVFGAPGTEFQHSFGQFLHQGPDLCHAMFITVQGQDKGWGIEARARLNANALAQADTLWEGRADADPAKVLPGARPSVVIDMPALDAFTLGQLLALFEHATVLDAFLSGVNPFDQWGVEAGKILAQKRINNGS